MADLFNKSSAKSAAGAKGGTDKNSYSAKDIEVLEGLEPVRKRPGMYIGGTDERALHHLAAEVLEMIEPLVQVGVTTGELDRICHDYITNTQQAIPAPLNYNGFPRSICTSVNDVVCHGIPSDSRKLKNGDIINIDVTVIKDGYHGDTSIMVQVGDVAPHAKRLIQITQECLYKALEVVKPGATLGDIGAVIQQHAEKNYYSVVREYCGHGIGSEFHEEPQYQGDNDAAS